MAEQKDPVLTDTGIALIVAMAQRGSHTQAVRHALRKQEGVWYRDELIQATAAEHGLEVPRTVLTTEDHAVRRLETQTMAKRVPDRVRLVPPGTYPARGYSMIGGKFR